MPQSAPFVPREIAPPPTSQSVTATPVGQYAPAGAPNGLTDVLAQIASHHAQLATMHRDFLAQQADVQQRFLAMRQSAEAGLLKK